MKTKCYSVRLKEFDRISDKAYKAVAFNGSEAIIPASQVFGYDDSSKKSTAIWITAWILSKKELQYSKKKIGWFNEFGKQMPTYKIEKHIPSKMDAVKDNNIKELMR